MGAGPTGQYLSGRQIPDLNSGCASFAGEPGKSFERFYPDGFSLTTTITLPR
jgi:hypothetical protein